MRLPARIVSYDPPRKKTVLFLTLFLMMACHSSSYRGAASVSLVQIPGASLGGPSELAPIQGTVKGARPGQQIVLYTKADQWYVQPMKRRPFTVIEPDGQWHASIHLGLEYAALLVNPGYTPSPRIESLPPVGGDVIAVGYAGPDRVGSAPPPKTLHFSGYEWTTRRMESPRNGQSNIYDPDNVWTDANGSLHLRISHRSGRWTCAEAALVRSFGYGTYRFTVHDVSQIGMIPAFSTYTFDDKSPNLNFREIAVELSRWGKPDNKNAQFVIQPYYISENVARFTAPAGSLTNSFLWQPGRVSFTSQRTSLAGSHKPSIAEHVFTSGIPVPGGETVHVNFSIPFGLPGEPTEAEVVLDRFEYLP